MFYWSNLYLSYYLYYVKLFSAVLGIFYYNLFQSTLDLSFRGINHSNIYIFPKALLCTLSAKSWKMAYFLVFKHILYNNDALPGNFSLYTFAQISDFEVRKSLLTINTSFKPSYSCFLLKNFIKFWKCAFLFKNFFFCKYVVWSVTQWCLTVCDPMDCRLPRFSVHGIFQAQIME